MQVIVAAIGRDRAGPTRDLFEDYRRRSPWPIRLVEIAPRSSQPIERRLREEGERLLQAVPPGAVLVALDEAGRQLDSAGLARRIARWQGEYGTLAFAIGGPGRPRPQRARAGRGHLRLRPDDLAAPPGARHAGRADLSCEHDPFRPSLPPRLSA